MCPFVVQESYLRNTYIHAYILYIHTYCCAYINDGTYMHDGIYMHTNIINTVSIHFSTKAKDELSKIGVKYGVLELDVS